MGEILVVDDERGIRRLVSAVLEDAGYTSRGCANGMEALEALTEETGLVILDLTMPVMSGDEFLRELRRRKHPAPVIILSAGNAAAVAAEFAVPALAKPFDVDELLTLVAATLDDRLTAPLPIPRS